MRLIEADALIDVLNSPDLADWLSEQEEYTPASIVEHALETLPTVDVVPGRHGKWIDSETFKRPWFRHHIFECSVCRNTLDMDGVNAGRGDANYCPNCGAKMESEHETD